MAKDVRRGMPKCVLVHGPSDFFRSEAIQQCTTAFPKAADVRTVAGDEDSDGQELQDLRGGALFGAGSVVVVRRGDAWLKKHGDAVAAVIPRIVDGCALVLEVGKLDKRRKATKALLEHASAYEFRDMYAEPFDRNRSPLSAELVGWIGQRAKNKGVALTPEGAFMILSSVGKVPAELVAEIERLGTRLQSEGLKLDKPLGPEELRGRLTVSFESTPFEFADAVLAGERRKAVRSLRAMFARGVRSKDGGSMDAGGVFPFVTSWLLQSLANAHAGRYLFDQGVRLDDIPQRLGVRMFADRFTATVRNNSLPALSEGLHALMEAQRGLRATGEDAERLLLGFLDRWFAEMSRPAAAKKASATASTEHPGAPRRAAPTGGYRFGRGGDS